MELDEVCHRADGLCPASTTVARKINTTQPSADITTMADDSGTTTSMLSRIKSLSARFDAAAEQWHIRKQCLVELRQLAENGTEADDEIPGSDVGNTVVGCSDAATVNANAQGSLDADALRACKLMLIHALMD